jgi:hypothetical protein
MRHLKLLAVVGLILAVSGTAEALTYIPFRESWIGPVYAHINDRAMGTTYLPVLKSGETFVMNKWYAANDLVIKDKADYSNALEVGWSIYSIDAIYKGQYDGFNTISPVDTDHPLYIIGDMGTEIVGTYFERQDLNLKFTSVAEFEYESFATQYEVFVQPLGTAAQVDANGHSVIGLQGGSGRLYDANTSTYLDKYLNIGYDASGNPLGDGPVLVLNEQTGFFGDMWDGATIDANGNPVLDPNTFPMHAPTENAGTFNNQTISGHNDVFLSVIGGSDANSWDSDFFDPNNQAVVVPWADPNDPNRFADFRLHVTSTTIAQTGDYDWLIQSSDPLTADYPIPEPLTALAVFTGIGGLGGYIRRRRRD